jgi:hypothetical protein
MDIFRTLIALSISVGCATATTPFEVAPVVDSGTGCPSGKNPCSVSPQCGCLSGETCEVDQNLVNGTTKCVRAGSRGTASACTATENQCATGFTCLGGVCRPYCSQEGAACSDPGTQTCEAFAFHGDKVPNLLACSIKCSLIDVTSCGGPASGCKYDSALGRTDCYAVATGDCAADPTACAPGYTCASVSGTSLSCWQWCRLDTGAPCGIHCVAVASPPTVDGVTYGICD